MSADDYSYRCAVLVRPSRNEVVLRSGRKGFGSVLAKWPLTIKTRDDQGREAVSNGRAEAIRYAERQSKGYIGLDMIVVTQPTEAECIAHDKMARS